jgi:hypothetical protein
VRLDHLLSKERWPSDPSGGPEPRPDLDGSPLPADHGVFGVVLEGGTLTSSAAGCCRLPVLHTPGVRGAESQGSRVVVGTLLGPEGAGPRRFPGRSLSCRAGLHRIPLWSPWGWQVWWGRVAGVWSYVENCTVDASIF